MKPNKKPKLKPETLTLRDALQTAVAALKRVQPQVTGVLCVQDVERAIEAGEKALNPGEPIRMDYARKNRPRCPYCTMTVLEGQPCIIFPDGRVIHEHCEDMGREALT